jgi:hypothetical protein
MSRSVAAESIFHRHKWSAVIEGADLMNDFSVIVSALGDDKIQTRMSAMSDGWMD